MSERNGSDEQLNSAGGRIGETSPGNASSGIDRSSPAPAGEQADAAGDVGGSCSSVSDYDGVSIGDSGELPNGTPSSPSDGGTGDSSPTPVRTSVAGSSNRIVVKRDFTSVPCLADMVMDGSYLRHWRGYFWEYADGAYVKIDPDKMLKIVFDKVMSFDPPPNFYISDTDKKHVLTLIRDRTFLDSNAQPPFYVDDSNFTKQEVLAVANGLLWIGDDPHFEAEHDPMLFIPGTLPYDYDQTATCNLWLAFLEETFAGDPDKDEFISYLQRWFGINLIFDCTQHQILLLYGKPRTGKGVLLSGLRELLGKNAHSSLSITSLNEPRFGRTQTLGMRANICDEILSEDRIDTPDLKMMSEGKPVKFEGKFKDAFHAPFTARLSFACNQFPKAKHGKDGIFERLVMIPCNNVVPPEDRDPDMGKDGYWRSVGELPGILNWALEGLMEYRRNDCKLLRPSRSVSLSEDMARTADPLAAWIDEHLQAGEADEPLWHSNMYDACCASCGMNPVPTTHAFTRAIGLAFPTARKQKRRVPGGFDHHWHGIRLK